LLNINSAKIAAFKQVVFAESEVSVFGVNIAYLA
jgi:hypothetical protein